MEINYRSRSNDNYIYDRVYPLARNHSTIPRFTIERYVKFAESALLSNTQKNNTEKSAIFTMVSLGAGRSTWRDLLGKRLISRWDSNGEANRVCLPKEVDGIRFTKRFKYLINQLASAEILDINFLQRMKLITAQNGIYGFTRGANYLMNLMNEVGGLRPVDSDEMQTAHSLSYYLNPPTNLYLAENRELEIARMFNNYYKMQYGVLSIDNVKSIRNHAKCLINGRQAPGFKKHYAGVELEINSEFCDTCPLLSRCGIVASNMVFTETAPVNTDMVEQSLIRFHHEVAQF